MARRAYLYSTSLVLRWMVRLNIGVLLLLFAASPIVVPIFFNIARASGNTYYVANAGLDSNVGTDTAHPWAHAPGMAGCINTCGSTTLAAGDSVLFNRGDTWAIKLDPASNGSAGSVIFYGAYGSGAQPIITGDGTTGIDASNLDYLTFDNLNVKTVVQAVRIYPTSGTHGHITIQNSTLGPVSGAGSGCVFIQPTLGSGQLTDLVINNNFCTPDPGSPPGTFLDNRFGFSISCLGGANCSNPTLGPGVLRFTISNNTEAANGAGKHCIQIWHASTGTVSGNTCDLDGQSNMDIKDSDHVTVTGNSLGDSQNVNLIFHDVDNNTLNFSNVATFNHFHNGGQGGVNYQDVSFLGCNQCVLEYNEVEGAYGDGMLLNDNHNSSAAAGTIIANNVWYGNGTAGGSKNCIDIQSGRQTLIYANSCYNPQGILLESSAATTGVTIKNNVIYSTGGGTLINVAAASETLFVADYNDWWSTGGTPFNWGGASSNFASWKTNSSGDAHSVNSDPTYTNPGSGNLTLQSTSPAIDAGTNLGAPYNMALDPRTSFPWSTLDQGIYGSWEIGAFVFVPNLGSGNQAEPRYDFLNNSATSATSNHTLVFTVQNSLDNTGGSASDTLALTFQSNFNLANITCGDVNVATGTRFLFNVATPEPRTNCPNTTTSWGLLVNTASRTITITVPASVKTYVATGTILTVNIGSNANYQNQGTHWIVNPSDAGTKSITIGGTFGGYGQILVSVNTPLQLSATVQETLTLTLTGLAGSGTGGMNSCSSNGTTDAEDGAAVNLVTTTAATVPFGTLSSSNTFYEGCQKVSITTNAGNGYTITTREDHSLHTASGLTIADTACDASGCLNTPSTAAAWVTNTNPGLGISCANAATSASCWTANPNWINGTRWAPLASEGNTNPTGGAETPAVFSGLSVATSVEVITKAKYRIAVPNSQPAGTYTNLVSFIATPVY